MQELVQVLEKITSVCPAHYQEGKIKKIDAKIIEKRESIYLEKMS